MSDESGLRPRRLFPYHNGTPNCDIATPKTRGVEAEKREPKVPLEPPTIVSEVELQRQRVRAGKEMPRYNRPQTQWQDSPRRTIGETTDQVKTSTGSHTNSVGGVWGNLGDGNNWKRPHKTCL